MTNQRNVQTMDSIKDLIHYRAMQREDYGQIAQFARTSNALHFANEQNESWFADFLHRNPGLCVVAQAHNLICGFGFCGYDGRRATLYHLFVQPNYQGKGVGSTILQSIEQAVAVLPIPRLRLMVIHINLAAQRYFESKGYAYSDDRLYAKTCCLVQSNHIS